MLVDGEIVRGGFIRFEPGNDRLTTQAAMALRTILSTLSGSPHKIIVRGYTAPAEGSGTYPHDNDLAYARAIRIMDYLVSLGLRQDFFEIDVVGSSATPDRANLPPGIDPRFIGAAAEILLSTRTFRVLQGGQEQRTTDAPIP
jgi:outer membrane protein OmpA-like peptidoglycan-associated protein